MLLNKNGAALKRTGPFYYAGRNNEKHKTKLIEVKKNENRQNNYRPYKNAVSPSI
ncbi:hypothetical protein NCCP28_07840 [Niallia sp. NCCP-28]|nr:hypothetical protein NCCP28_07840 [Niallia sp. NCCP-28]